MTLNALTSAVRDAFPAGTKWLNENQGVLAVLLWVVSLALAWTSGLFGWLRRRPEFRLGLIDGPTFVCTFHVGKKHGSWDVHRTAIALYIRITNVGSAPSSIAGVWVGYRWRPWTTPET